MEPKQLEHQVQTRGAKERVPSRKPFVKPQLRRSAKLPEVTNAFIGSFNP